MIKYYVLDAEKHLVETDIAGWGLWYAKNESRIVARTLINNECRVSTVFLGIDHGLRCTKGGIPKLFETMVFGCLPSLNRFECHYASWDDAVAGHQVVVRKVREVINHATTS